MLILADTHVHIYPCHDFARAFGSIVAAMDLHAGGRDHVKVACLAERSDCRWFESVATGRTALPSQFGIERGVGGDESITVSGAGQNVVFVAGRQIRTAEGLEVLSLTSDKVVPDGLPVREAINAVRDAGAVPVLTWAMGKWTFKRGRIAAELIGEAKPGSLLAGDSSLRPACMEEHRIFRVACDRDIAVVAGSDPLPVPGEEKHCGAFFTVLSGEYDFSRPALSLRRLLPTSDSVIGQGGRRSSLSEALERLARNYLAVRRTFVRHTAS